MSTRERILIEASKLFAHKGYLDTGTRDIAVAVGIRQPSLFHHFASKAEIFAELLSRDLTLALGQLRTVAAADLGESVASRLFAYLVWDTDSITYMPTNILGLYDRAILGESTFAPQWAQRAELHVLTEALVQEGIDAGEFTAEPGARFVRQTISALTLNTALNKTNGALGLDAAPDELALFVVRSVLVDVGSMPTVRERGLALWRRLSARSVD